MVDESYKWKSVPNNYYFHTESENPILKRDEHHAEIIDITDGLVVSDSLLSANDYALENQEVLKQDTIMDAFSKRKI